MANTTLTNAGNYDILLAKFNSSGLPVWVKSEGGSGYDYGYSVCTNTNSNIFVSGYFSSANLALGNTTLACTGGSDFFLAKLGPVTTTIGETLIAKDGYDVYPNPFSDYFKINLNTGDALPIRIEVSDVTGKIIKCFDKSELVPQNNLLEIRLGDKIKYDEIYFLKIISSEGVTIKKILRKGM